MIILDSNWVNLLLLFESFAKALARWSLYKYEKNTRGFKFLGSTDILLIHRNGTTERAPELRNHNTKEETSTHPMLALLKVSAVARRVDKGGVTGRGLLRENNADLKPSSGYILSREFQKN